MKTLLLSTALLVTAAPALANQFGQAGYDGRNGLSGRDGVSGRNVTVVADGTATQYDLSGGNGGDAYRGEDGYYARGCNQPGDVPYDLEGAPGGSGGQGGFGGSGGDAGDLVAYFADLTALKQVYVRAQPGLGGRGAYGGRGATGCRCQRRQWTITRDGQSHTYQCRDGGWGWDGRGGSNGRNGTAGRVLLINQLAPLQAALPSAYVEMSRMDFAPVQLAANQWETKRGAAALLAAGSVVNDTYQQATGRNAVTYLLKWDAPRSKLDFSNWHVLVKLDGAEPKLLVPDDLWYDGEATADGDVRTFTFRAAVKAAEVGNLGWAGASGFDAAHAVKVKDSSRVSDMVQTGVHLEYQTVENGRYVVRFKADVPADAVTATKDGITVALGGLGIEPKRLEIGTSAYAKVTMTRKVGAKSAKWWVASEYRIKAVLAVGDAVDTRVASDMMSGSTVVGHVGAGERYHVAKIDGDWIQLAKDDGTTLRGWITVYNLKPAPAE